MGILGSNYTDFKWMETRACKGLELVTAYVWRYQSVVIANGGVIRSGSARRGEYRRGIAMVIRSYGAVESFIMKWRKRGACVGWVRSVRSEVAVGRIKGGGIREKQRRAARWEGLWEK